MTKKALLFIALAISIVACNKPAEAAKEVKTAYVDTSELMKQYTEAKDLEAKYKSKAEEKGGRLGSWQQGFDFTDMRTHIGCKQQR